MKKKGLTLVEVIITLAIFSIIVPVIFFFYMSHYKALDKATVMSDLQLQGELSREKITEIFMEGSSIESVIDKEGNDISLMTAPMEISRITFINGENDIYELYMEDELINYLKNENYESKIAECVELMAVNQADSRNVNMKDINIINFHIGFKEKDLKYEVNFNVNLRNKE